MTTTAFDDQFTVAPAELVRHPYDTVAVLRRYVEYLEIALRKQTERAEAAEAELMAIREDNHSMMLEIHNLRIERDELAAELAKLREQEPLTWGTSGELMDILKNPIYAAPIPAPAATAPTVPEEWREFVKKTAEVGLHATKSGFECTCYRCVAIRGARALLQSADHSEQTLEKVDPDCRNCANRGQVNGLSQESYCDSCIYQGRDWRQNHFVDAVKRRCEACAILPCSCK